MRRLLGKAGDWPRDGDGYECCLLRWSDGSISEKRPEGTMPVGTAYGFYHWCGSRDEARDEYGWPVSHTYAILTPSGWAYVRVAGKEMVGRPGGRDHTNAFRGKGEYASDPPCTPKHAEEAARWVKGPCFYYHCRECGKLELWGRFKTLQWPQDYTLHGSLRIACCPMCHWWRRVVAMEKGDAWELGRLFGMEPTPGGPTTLYYKHRRYFFHLRRPESDFWRYKGTYRVLGGSDLVRRLPSRELYLSGGALMPPHFYGRLPDTAVLDREPELEELD